jgi:hypothetical protein
MNAPHLAASSPRPWRLPDRPECRLTIAAAGAAAPIGVEFGLPCCDGRYEMTPSLNEVGVGPR